MKMRITYYDQVHDRDINIDSQQDYGYIDPAPFDGITTGYEKLYGITIDHGGDDDFYELDIADYDPAADIADIANKLLRSIEDVLYNDRT